MSAENKEQYPIHVPPRVGVISSAFEAMELAFKAIIDSNFTPEEQTNLRHMARQVGTSSEHRGPVVEPELRPKVEARRSAEQPVYEVPRQTPASAVPQTQISGGPLDLDEIRRQVAEADRGNVLLSGVNA